MYILFLFIVFFYFQCVLDAELLLLTQPYTRVLSSKKIPLTGILKFLISKGLIPTPDMTKGDLCLAFKSLVENQPDYISQLVQPMQMSMPNNMLALSQNNNMMQPPHHSLVQQVTITIKLYKIININFTSFVKVTDPFYI